MAVQNIIIDTFQFKRGTAASLALANPKLLLGEPAFEKDTRRLKIGNGEDTWDNLGYITADSTGLNNLIEDTTPQLGGNLDLNGNYITGLRIGIDVQAYSSALSLVSGTNTGDQDISGIAINAANINTNTDNIAANTLAISNLATTASELPFLPNGSISATNVQDAIQEVRDEATSGALSSIDINTSAKIRTIVTDETGTGSLVFGTSPTLITPNLGTPSALILTNSTLLPNSAIPTNTIAVEKLQYSSRTEGEVIKINAGISSWGLITDENITDNSITISKLSTTGIASGTTYLRGDGSWSTPVGGGGDVSKVGTPVDNQVTVWTGNGTVEGTSGLTYNGTTLGITGNVTLSGTVDSRDIAGDGIILDSLNTYAITSDPSVITNGVKVNEIVMAPTADIEALVSPDVNTIYIPTDSKSYEYIQVACSDLATNITTGTSKAFTISPVTGTVTAVYVDLLTAGTSTGITVDINKNATTILSTKLTTDATETSSRTATTAAVISVSAITEGDRLTFDFDAVPTGGKGVIVTLKIQKT